MIPTFITVYDNIVNVSELLYVKAVKNGKLYVCVFKGEKQVLFLSVEEGESLLKQIAKLRNKESK